MGETFSSCSNDDSGEQKGVHWSSQNSVNEYEAYRQSPVVRRRVPAARKLRYGAEGGGADGVVGESDSRTGDDYDEGDDSDSDDDDEKTVQCLLVAKSLPIRCWKEEGKWQVEWNDARDFLANMRKLTGEKCGMTDLQFRFVGTVSVDVPKEERDDFEDALDRIRCTPVYLSKELRDKFFGTFCKNVLWPILHYVIPHRDVEWAKRYEDAWKAYTQANIIFSQTIARVVENSRDMVWIHNYHLLLLPSFVRNKLPRAKIGFFVHTPWPSSDIMRMLPSVRDLLSSLLCCDLIGFHTFDYVRHFLSTCKRVLDIRWETLPGGRMGVTLEGRTVAIIISHVGIDSGFIVDRARTNEIKMQVDAIKERANGRQVIAGLDDLDMCKGTVLKFQAFERFLSDNPDWVNKVVLVNVILPGSVDQAQRTFAREAISNQVQLIIEKFGPEVIQVDFVTSVTYDQVLALYRASQVGLISAFWDGLNVGPYEFTAAQDRESPGSLIISEYMGCSRSISGVTRVNPWCLSEVSEAILKELTTTQPTRSGHHQRRLDYVMKHTAVAWGKNFIKSLEEASLKASSSSFVRVGFGSCARLVSMKSGFKHLEDLNNFCSSYQLAGRRVILIDYDGTLIPHWDNGFSGPGRDVTDALTELSHDTRSCVFVVSGRGRDYLSKWFGHIENLGLAAEKGYFLRWPKRLENLRADRETSMWEKTCSVNMKWKGLAMELVREYRARVDGSWIEDKESAIVWHFNDCDVDFGKMQADELGKYLMRIINPEHAEVLISHISRHLELKPVGVGKAAVSTLILQRFLRDQPRSSEPFILAIGDDQTDEEMFEVVLKRTDKGVDERASLLQSFRTLKQKQKKQKSNIEEGNPKDSYSSSTYTCCVGMKPSEAQYYLHDHEDVLDALNALGRMVNKRPAQSGQSGQRQ